MLIHIESCQIHQNFKEFAMSRVTPDYSGFRGPVGLAHVGVLGACRSGLRRDFGDLSAGRAPGFSGLCLELDEEERAAWVWPNFSDFSGA